MRNTYKYRSEFKTDLYPILIQLSTIYFQLGDNEKIVECIREGFDVMGDTLIYYEDAPVHLTMAMAYKNMGMLDMAKKCAQ